MRGAQVVVGFLSATVSCVAAVMAYIGHDTFLMASACWLMLVSGGLLMPPREH